MWESVKQTVTASPYIKMALVLGGIGVAFVVTQPESARPRDPATSSAGGMVQHGIGETLAATGNTVVDSAKKGGEIVSDAVDTAGVAVKTVGTVVKTGAKVVDFGAGVVSSFLPD